MLEVAMQYLRAAGSIMDIYPSTDYRKVVGYRDDVETLRRDTMAIANDMESALDAYNKGRKQTYPSRQSR